MDNFGEILSYFKKIEEPENIVPLVEDAQLRNALVAWKGTVIQFKPSGPCPFKDDAQKWQWLWSQVAFDRSEFGVVSGAKAQDVGNILTRLQGLRLIYPDGTINDFASKYLQSIIMAKLQHIAPRGKRFEDKKDTETKKI